MGLIIENLYFISFPLDIFIVSSVYAVIKKSTRNILLNKSLSVSLIIPFS